MKPFKDYNKQEIIRTKGKNLTKEQRNLIGIRNLKMANLKKYRNLSWSEIGKRFNLHPEYVKKVCHKLGVRGGIQKNSAAQKSLIKEL